MTGSDNPERSGMRDRWRLLMGAAATMAVVFACAAVPAAGSSSPPSASPRSSAGRGARFSPATIRAINSIALAGMGSAGAPGMEVGVWIPGKGSYQHGYGTDDLATGKPFKAVDHVRMASISKTFTATAALELVDRGELKLSDTLNMFCGAIPGCSRIPYVDQITVGELLGMRAGVYSYSDDERFNTRYEARPTMPFSIGEVVKIIAEHAKQAVKPGAETHYSNSDYYLLGVVVEAVTGEPLSQVIPAMVLKPLELSQTSYPTGTAVPAPFAHGYLSGSEGAAPRDVTRSNPAVAAGAGGMISTLADLRKWARDLATGSLLTPA